MSPSDIVVQAQVNAAKEQHAAKVPKKPKWMKTANKFMESGEVQLFLGVLLMLSLFLADSWILGNAPDGQDDGMFSVLMFVVVVFTIEVAAMSVVSDGYFNSFFFWMDFLGTLSILLDIGWISEQMFGGGGSDTVRRGSVLRATRAAKLGARYGRILRLMKLMKLAKMCPCLKSKHEADAEAEPTLSAVVKISQELTGTISRRVALLVVLVVIVVPFLNYSVTDFSPDAYLGVIKNLAKRPNCNQTEVEHFMGKFQRFYRHKDLRVSEIEVQSPYASCGGTLFPNGTVDPTATQTTLYHAYSTGRDVTKDQNLFLYANDIDGNHHVRVTIDNTIPHQWGSFYGIVLMILVIGVLFGFSASFHNSIDTLVVSPLQKLMGTLRKSAQMMIDALKSLEKEKKDEEKKKKAEEAKKTGKSDTDTINDDSDEEDEDEEAAMLENLVQKVSRIVKHVLPPTNDIVDLKNENVDKATADWLNQQYTTNHGTKDDDSKPLDIASLAPISEGMELTAAEKEKLSIQKLSEEKVVKIIGGPITKLDSFEFDTLMHTNEELIEVVHYLFDVTLGFFEEFKVPPDVFDNFLGTLAKRYINTNPYHHFKHAVDVCHTCYRLFMMAELNPVSTGGSGSLSNLEMFATLVGALGHDVGHPAVNNGFLVKSKHALAFQHNDKSPLENMHCVVLYEILQNSGEGSLQGTMNSTQLSSTASPRADCNIFVNLTESQWRDARKVILAVILGTDMIHHFEQVKKTQLFNDLNNESVCNYYTGDAATMECLKDTNNRFFIMEVLLHSSDISNPFKPFPICAKWADLVMAEFFAQGDQERDLGFDISPGFDRTVTNIFNMQMGFIEFVVAPLISAVVNIFPSLHEIGDNMTDNFCTWGQKRLEEIPNDPKIAAENKNTEIGKLEDRLKKFKDKMSFLDKCRDIIDEAREKKEALIDQAEKAQNDGS